MQSTRIKNYEDALRYLLALTTRGIKPGLSRVRSALRRMGQPHQRLFCVVVGGTNGKGSVSTIVAKAASEQGLRVGLFTSPHLHRLTERIKLDGREIGRARLVEVLQRVIDALEVPGGPALSFFETLTVVAAEFFAQEKVDLAVFEVGLGGRLDATKVMPAKVVAITGIALDHQHYLGDTLESIAREKFALARRGAIVVAGELPEHLGEMLIDRSRRARAVLWLAGRDFTWQEVEGHRLDVRGRAHTLRELPLPLLGRHQAHNAAVAVTALEALSHRGLEVEERAIRRGLSRARVKWPGRLEMALGGRVLFDVAHNPNGMEALCAALPTLAGDRRPLVAVLGCMRDKDIEGIVTPLASEVDELLFAAPKMPRALPSAEFPQRFGGRRLPSVEAACDEALRLAGAEGLVVIAGSTFTVSEARAHLLGLVKVDPSIPM